MAGDSRLVTENFLRLNFTPKGGTMPGTEDTLHMDCDQIKSRYQVGVSGVTSSGTRLPAQNQVVAWPVAGDAYQGGIVAYIFVSGDTGYVDGECHGIIASTSDQSANTDWVPSDASTPFPLIGTYSEIGKAVENTSAIISTHGVGVYAAYLARSHSSDGYNDFQLPTKSDLACLYGSKGLIGGFTTGDIYWTSTEVDYNHAWGLEFGSPLGRWDSSLKRDNPGVRRVRAIRYF